MLDSIATVIQNGIDNKLLSSPSVSLFIDESTDIAVHKKLAAYACVLDPKTFEPSTHFVTNVRLEYGTGKAISEKVKTIVEDKDLKLGKVLHIFQWMYIKTLLSFPEEGSWCLWGWGTQLLYIQQDCERGFSLQNSLQTSVRNRLSICLAALEKDKRKEDLYRLTTGKPFQLKQTWFEVVVTGDKEAWNEKLKLQCFSSFFIQHWSVSVLQYYNWAN